MSFFVQLAVPQSRSLLCKLNLLIYFFPLFS